jgi:WD40 repeat protein
MSRSPFALCTLLVLCAGATAAPVPPSLVPKDRDGYPLPTGATARLGSLAFRLQSVYGGVWYSADGANLYAWARDQSVIGWDARTGKRLANGPFPLGHKFVGHIPVVAGGRVITFDDVYEQNGLTRFLGRTAVVTGPDGKVLSRVDCSSMSLGTAAGTNLGQFAVSRDGSHAAHVSDDGTVRVFNLTTGKELFKDKFATNLATCVALAPDGKTLFLQEHRKSLRRFSVADGKELTPLVTDEGTVASLAISADGTRAATAVLILEKMPSGGLSWTPQKFVTVHDLTTGKAVGKIEVDGRASCGPMIGPDALIVGSGRARPPAPSTGAMARWNLKTLKKEWEIQDLGGLTPSPDGKQFALSTIAGVRIYDAATGKRVDQVVAHPHPVIRIEFSADGETVTTRCRAAAMTWALDGKRKSVTDGPEMYDARGDGPTRDSPRVWFEIGADGKTVELAGGHFDARKDGWRVPLGANVPERPLTVDGKRVFGAVYDRNQARWDVTVFDGPAGKRLSTWTAPAPAPAPTNPAMVLTGDGKTVFGFDGDVVGRDPDTGKEKLRVKTGPVEMSGGTYFPYQLATTHTGDRIAVVQQKREGGGTLRVFDTKTGKELAGHDIGRAYFPELRFDRTGARVAVRSGPVVLLCDATGTAALRKLEAGSIPPTAMAFSPNGATLAVGYEDGTALLWDMTAK